MIFFPVVNEACRVLSEGIAVKAADLDISAVMGMGFPPYRYEMLADSKRFTYVSSIIEKVQKENGCDTMMSTAPTINAVMTLTSIRLLT